jgi:hypothetical protein
MSLHPRTSVLFNIETLVSNLMKLRLMFQAFVN